MNSAAISFIGTVVRAKVKVTPRAFMVEREVNTST